MHRENLTLPLYLSACLTLLPNLDCLHIGQSVCELFLIVNGSSRHRTFASPHLENHCTSSRDGADDSSCGSACVVCSFKSHYNNDACMVRRQLVTKLLRPVIQNHLSNSRPLSLSLAMTEEVESSSGKVENRWPPQGSPLQKKPKNKKTSDWKKWQDLESSHYTETIVVPVSPSHKRNPVAVL